MNRYFSIACTALAVVLTPAYGGIVNGSFESPVIGAATFLNVAPGGEPAGFDWLVTTNTVDIISQGVLGSTAPMASGTQAVDLVGLGSTGGIQQSFSTVAGMSYTLQFSYANNPIAGGSPSALVTIKDGSNTLLSQTVTHSTSNGGNFDWNVFSMNFVASGTTATLQFETSVGGNNGGVFVDDVSVELADTSVPEPATLSMLALAFASLAWRRAVRNG